MAIYSEEHLIFQQSIRRFAEKHILPHLNSWEEGLYFPSEIFLEMGRQGFLGILVHETFGGVGGDQILAAAWCEEFGRIPSVGFTTAVNMHSIVITPALAKLGSDAAKEKWLKLAVEGKAVGAYAFTEPGAGSDLTQIQTKAVKEGNYYRLNGSKIFITNGKRADFVLVLAKTNENMGYDGYTTFAVDSNLPGFEVSRTLKKLGWHCSDTAELTFTDVMVPDSMVLGQVSRGWHQAMESLQGERLMLVLNAIGGAQSCLEKTVAYINERKVFGKSVGTFDVNRETFSTLWSKLESAKAYAHRCVLLLNNNQPCRKEVSLAKLFACELAIDIADFCLQLHGGYGYITEFLPERWLRDLRLNTIGGGTSQIMSRIAAKEMFGV